MIAKEQVEQQALSLFSRYGLKSVNMDDLARELCISKKTLYQIYSSKEELVLSLFEKISDSWDNHVSQILDTSENPLLKFLKFTFLRYQFLKRLNPAFLLRSGKQYEKVYSFMNNVARDMEETVISLLQEALNQNQLHPTVDLRTFYHVHELTLNAYFEQYNPVMHGTLDSFKHMVVAPIAGISKSTSLNVWDEFDSLSQSII